MSDLALGKGTMVSGIAMLRDGKPFKLLHEDKTGLVKELPTSYSLSESYEFTPVLAALVQSFQPGF